MRQVLVSPASNALAVVVAMSPFGALAAPPNGSFEIAVAGSQQVLLPYGTFRGCTTDPDVVLCFEVPLFSDSAGTVSGNGAVQLTGIADGALGVTAEGKLTGRASQPKMQGTMRFAGDFRALGDFGTGKGSIKFSCSASDLSVYPALCKARLAFCGRVPGRGRLCRTKSGPIPIFNGSNGGDWTLTLDLVTDDAREVTGTAEVTLPGGQPLDFLVTGKYDAKNDVSNLKFEGIGLAERAQLSLKKFSPEAHVGRLKFKIAGQTGSVDLSTLP
jgi:hypothetical protein